MFAGRWVARSLQKHSDMNANMNLTGNEFTALVLAQLTAAGVVSKEDVQATMQRMALKLQEGYTGRLYEMAPQSYTGNTQAPLARWTATYVFVILDLCKKHGRTSTQVMDALIAILPAV